jgi:hypothetical protein
LLRCGELGGGPESALEYVRAVPQIDPIGLDTVEKFVTQVLTPA